MGKDMYDGMSALSEETAIIARGMALHKVIRLITMAIGEPVSAISGPVAPAFTLYCMSHASTTGLLTR